MTEMTSWKWVADSDLAFFSLHDNLIEEDAALVCEGSLMLSEHGGRVSRTGARAAGIIGVAFAAAMFAAPDYAYALTILTWSPEPAPGVQQTLNSPCIFGDPSCTNPVGFELTDLPNNNAGGDYTSPTYTVGQIRSIVGDTFDVGIDIGYSVGSGNSHFLNYFDMENITAATILAIYDPADPGPALGSPGNNPGNGFSDFRLASFDLTGLADAIEITFHLNMTTLNDGPDEFFIFSTGVAPIPLPAAFPLFVTALGGMGLLGWLRRRKAAAA